MLLWLILGAVLVIVGIVVQREAPGYGLLGTLCLAVGVLLIVVAVILLLVDATDAGRRGGALGVVTAMALPYGGLKDAINKAESQDSSSQARVLAMKQMTSKLRARRKRRAPLL